MRKIICLMFVFLLLPVNVYATVSNDQNVYLRNDVFEAKMEALRSDMRLEHQRLENKIDKTRQDLENKIDKTRQDLENKIDSLHSEILNNHNSLRAEMNAGLKRLEDKITAFAEKTDARIDGLRDTIYWGLSFFGILIAVFTLIPWAQNAAKKYFTPPVTIEQVEEIINAKFSELAAKNVKV